ncbi:MAG TPA: M48 family metallopeptidase [Candidatus Sulfomarinibacteraceae bacterium]|nr:M48 family metallopeptidase [Candidatus Sulfomarinibacteraceae bacterium]
MAPVPPSLTVEGIRLKLSLTRKRVKNINARLVGDELRVSAPPRVSDAELAAAVDELARKLVRRQRARAVNGENDALELARKVAQRFPRPPSIARAEYSTNQRSRWGSYSQRTRTVRLNAALREMPRWVLEAVLAHELAHVVYPDHSPAFWRLLRQVCPATDRARAFLEGVAWTAAHWEALPPVERALLRGPGDDASG